MSGGMTPSGGRENFDGNFRKATLAENLRILLARMSEHLSPAEQRELEECAARLESDVRSAGGEREPVAWRYRTRNSAGQWSMWVVTSELPKDSSYESEVVPLYARSASGERNAVLDEALKRCADYHGDDALLDAPCIFCGYSGQGYWQSGTHNENCRWRNIGGFNGRRAALTSVAIKNAAPQERPLDTNGGREAEDIRGDAARGEAPRVPAAAAPSMASAIPTITVTQAMVDAVNTQDGWSGFFFTVKDLQGIVDAIASSARQEPSASGPSAAVFCVEPEALKLAEYWKNWNMSDGVGVMARELLRLSAIKNAAPQVPQQEVSSGVVESNTGERPKARDESGSDTVPAAAAPDASSASGTIARRDAAQLAFDQQSDDPAPGDWNDACRRIASLLNEPARRTSE